MARIGSCKMQDLRLNPAVPGYGKPPEEGDGGMPRHAERPHTCGRSVIRDCPDQFLRYKGGFIGGGISMGAAGFPGDSTGSDMLLGATGFSMYFFGSPSNVSLHPLLQNPYVFLERGRLDVLNQRESHSADRVYFVDTQRFVHSSLLGQ